MNITFDPDKAAANLAKHGVGFAAMAEFDWSTARFSLDTRFEYAETRLIAYGMIDDRLHAVVFTSATAGIRIISLRKANQRELRRYEQI